MKKTIIIDDNFQEIVDEYGYQYEKVVDTLIEACEEAKDNRKEVVITIQTQQL